MKKIGLLIIVVLIAIFIWRFFFAVSDIPVFKRVEHLEIKDSSGNFFNLNAEILLYNPGTWKAKLINTELSAFANDLKIATISQTEIANLEPKKDFRVPLHCKIDWLKLGRSQGLSAWIEKALNQNRTLNIRFEGYCNVRVNGAFYRIPVQHEEVITLK